MSLPQPAHRAVRPGAAPSAWRGTAIALAIACALGLSTPDAQALSLGRVTVQSALGEPLRAEIDIPQITPDEVANLRTALGSPEAFRAAGMERSPALAGLQISLQQRPNGTHFLRLSSERVINEPFLDLILEASGPAGRIVREYTLLFDPPSLRQQAAPATPLPAQVTGPSAPPPPAPAAEATVTPVSPALSPSPPAPPAPEPAAAAAASAPAAPAPAPAPAPAAATAASAAASSPKRRVTVQAGQTAGAIAAANRPGTVSLDQMLVALLRANPDAFVSGNVNRLKAGAVLDMPSEEQAAAIGQPEARQTLVAQSKDFNEFKQRLAEGVAERPAAASAAGRTASGQVQARVEEKKPAPAASDRLTLSKGAVEEGSRDGKAPEDRIARERAEREAAARAAEIDRNIADLKRLGNESASLATPPAAAASAASGAGGIPVPAQVPGAAAEAASAPASATAQPRPATPPSEASGWLDSPLLAGAAAALVALLIGLGLYRRQQLARQTAAAESPEADESRLEPDSFFGGSGGQHIDTAHAPSSMMYSPSQIDAAADVDPVAEADVYLAYGRDLQAEEILREALRTTPQRVAVHAKLLEILARRNDPQAFESVARDAHALTAGSGPVWAQIASLGLELDPANPLYLGTAPAPLASATASSPDTDTRADAAAAPAVPPGLDLDFASFKAQAPATPMVQAGGSPFDFGDEPEPAPAAKADHAAMDFDLAGLSLELDDPARNTPATASSDALSTKLSLAEEFLAIGDTDGARSLVQEVLAEASGDLRRRAERLLAELG